MEGTPGARCPGGPFHILFATPPYYPYSRTWGYYPGGIIAALLILWLALIWFGYVAAWYPWRAAVVEAPGVVGEEVAD